MAIPYSLNRLTNRRGLLDFLGISEELFDLVIEFEPPALNADGISQAVEDSVAKMPAFIRHHIPKRNYSRGHRTVWQPYLAMQEYKALARRLDVFFGVFLKHYPHDNAFGYRPRRNIRENAAVHRGHYHLLRTDIRDFFPSISTAMVQDLFESLEVKPEIAELLARFLTIGGSLPLGLPTSPVKSNAVALPVDMALGELAEATSAVYSRYSDDISFSGDDVLPDIDDIAAILGAHCFRLAEEKTRRSKRGQAHFVTGLSVTDPEGPHVPRRTKRTLRQELYYAGKFGLDDHLGRTGLIEGSSYQQQVNRLDGTVKFVAHHEPALAPALDAAWKSIMKAEFARPSFVPRNQHQAPFVVFVDEAEFERDGERLLALCMVATQHPEHVTGATEEVWVRLVNDLWADGDVTSLRRGLHFADATQDQRLEFVKRLASLPVAAYVAYAPIDDTGYEATYLCILESMLPRRLMAAESKFAAFVFEKTDKVSQTAITAAVNAAQAVLERPNNRRPVMVQTDFAGKPHLGIATADFFLGVLGTYLRSTPPPSGKPETRDRLMFDRLRDRYRVISDLASGREFTRRTPISSWREQAAASECEG